MVQISDKVRRSSNGQIIFEKWFEDVSIFYTKKRLQTIVGALDILTKFGIDEPARQGGNCFDYGIEIASILFDIQADEESVAAAMLFELYCTDKIVQEDITEKCGLNVSKILDGSKTISSIKILQNVSSNNNKLDNFRKMLLTIIKDARIVLIKLADIIYTSRTSKGWTKQHKEKIGHEIIEIYAPLANRLGLSKIKWEMEDRAFSMLYPTEYKKIAKSIDMRRLDRDEYIENTISTLENELSTQGIPCEIAGRAKHIYSIWRKITKKNCEVDDIYDAHAIRVLVNSVNDCYKVLSIVNSTWKTIQSEFTDYIANPKPNGYKSVHTIVIGPKNLVFEIQIRTNAMHNESETGVAAHWRYKEGVKHDPSYEARIIWLRSLLDWQSELQDINDDSFKNISSDDRVYAFTPSGDVIDISKGGTALDFSYSIHTMVGHRTKGAKINNRIVPLTTKVMTGDNVEILTHKDPKPNLDWANEKLGYISSAKIRGRVIRWFKKQNEDNYDALGKEKLLDAIKKVSTEILEIDYLAVAKYFNFESENSLYRAIGLATIKTGQITNYIIDKYKKNEVVSQSDLVNDIKRKENLSNSSLTISGISNVMQKLAGCCMPINGDEIVGYLTHDKGVTIHRSNCKNFIHLQSKHPNRFIETSWSNIGLEKYNCEFVLNSSNITKSYDEILHLIKYKKIKLVHIKKIGKENLGTIKVKLMLKDIHEANSIIVNIQSITGVTLVKRKE